MGRRGAIGLRSVFRGLGKVTKSSTRFLFEQCQIRRPIHKNNNGQQRSLLVSARVGLSRRAETATAMVVPGAALPSLAFQPAYPNHGEKGRQE